MILTLIRHGQTEGSLRDLYYGAADIPVLPESLAELHAHAAQYPTAPRYFTSGLVRSRPSAPSMATCPTRRCRGCGRWTSVISRCAAMTS